MVDLENWRDEMETTTTRGFQSRVVVPTPEDFEIGMRDATALSFNRPGHDYVGEDYDYDANEWPEDEVWLRGEFEDDGTPITAKIEVNYDPAATLPGRGMFDDETLDVLAEIMVRVLGDGDPFGVEVPPQDEVKEKQDQNHGIGDFS